MKKITFISFLLWFSFALPGFAQLIVKTQTSPITSITQIADKLIGNISFNYRLTPVIPDKNFNNIVFINLKHNFQIDQQAIAYAISSLYSPVDKTLNLQIIYSKWQRCKREGIY